MNTKIQNLPAFNLLKPMRVIDDSIDIDNYIPINISETNQDLKTFDISSSREWEQYISLYLNKHKKRVAYGGYLEVRTIYTRSDYFNKNDDKNTRNIHLGMDFWCAEGTSVLAAIDGEIHSFKNNTNYGDYGPAIILKHKINTVEFYTLYGHLSLESIQDLKVGEEVLQGKTIGYLGNASVNGDYAPHLHFQIIYDMQGFKGDYPGVCNKKDLSYYKTNCPDPNLLLRLY